ncbi:MULTISPECIES: hypothetical protein [unclassified Variovorax]|uniref:hypothetical protein n=1 Tax=unclassified Variovorax TaxID=663243 RepID=UPI0011AF6EA3|nr:MULTISPECIES: hypothetical protein [unclassified Variovorax]
MRRTTETFVERLLVGGERQTFHFEREIVWLQESEAMVRFVHGGKEIKHGSTHTDFYGYLSAAEHLVDEAARTAQAFSVTTESSLAIEVVARVHQRPVTEPEEARKYNATKPANYKSRWGEVPDDWRKDVLVDGEALSRSFARVELAEELVWTSKQTAQANQGLLAVFQARWAVRTAASEPVDVL